MKAFFDPAILLDGPKQIILYIMVGHTKYELVLQLLMCWSSAILALRKGKTEVTQEGVHGLALSLLHISEAKVSHSVIGLWSGDVFYCFENCLIVLLIDFKTFEGPGALLPDPIQNQWCFTVLTLYSPSEVYNSLPITSWVPLVCAHSPRRTWVLNWDIACH